MWCVEGAPGGRKEGTAPTLSATTGTHLLHHLVPGEPVRAGGVGHDLEFVDVSQCRLMNVAAIYAATTKRLFWSEVTRLRLRRI